LPSKPRQDLADTVDHRFRLLQYLSAIESNDFQAKPSQEPITASVFLNPIRFEMLRAVYFDDQSLSRRREVDDKVPDGFLAQKSHSKELFLTKSPPQGAPAVSRLLSKMPCGCFQSWIVCDHSGNASFNQTQHQPRGQDLHQTHAFVTKQGPGGRRGLGVVVAPPPNHRQTPVGIYIDRAQAIRLAGAHRTRILCSVCHSAVYHCRPNSGR
jgi:hypothetical protein